MPPNVLFGNIDNYAEIDDKIFTEVLAYCLKWGSISFRNFSHGADRDALPGDTDIIDLHGNAGLHVGRYVSQLRGSPICYVDASNLTNTIRTVAVTEEQHFPLAYSMKSGDLFVNDLAVTASEAYGVADQPPFQISGDELTLTDANAIPLYRIQHVEGAAVDGREDIIVQAPETTHYCTTEPSILSKDRTGLTGELSKASAVGISSIKSPAIQAIQQVNYSEERSPLEQDDILQPYNYTASDEQPEQKVDPGIKIDDAAINKIIDRLLTGDYLEKLKEKLAEHGLKVSSTETTLAAKIKGDWKLGPTSDPAYPPPPYIQLTDPVSGKVTSYYASDSFITQEPDGSILISDGYGSEIRMSRGNIYISPALDLFFRPGRDLSAMVPRHQSYNAQGYTTINSSKSMYLRAIGDLKLVGATGKAGGMVTLECAAKEDGVNNGLLLKSTKGVAMVGNDIYIGRTKGNGVAKNVIEEPTDQGSIIIDACSSGAISIRAKESTTDAETVCLVASNRNAASAIRISPSSTGIYTNSVELPASVSMVGKQSAEKVTLVRNGTAQEINLTTVNGAPRLIVEGHTLVGGMFLCNGAGHFSGMVTAKGVGSTSQYCGVLDTSLGDPFKKTEIKKLDAHTMADFSAEMLEKAGQYMYQDVFVTVNGFAFPTSYNVPTTLRVPGMRWQTMDRDGAPTWEETAVISIDKNGKTIETMCYPGKTVWDEAKISGPDYKTENLNRGYTTNAPKE